MEAFLRWPHPTLGLIPPEHLLDLAEESGLIHPLTTWVFDQAIADCARWWREGHRVAVAVNLLATDLLDSALPRRMVALLNEAGLGPEALVLEITEGMVMADLTRSKRVIQCLAEAGIMVSIDDFGTGFSSLSHLNELAVGEVKLDRTFTSRLQLGAADPTGRESRPLDHRPRSRSRASRCSRGYRAARLRQRSGWARVRLGAGIRDPSPVSSCGDRFRRVEETA